MVCTPVYRYFHICTNWTQFHTELIFLKGMFQKNGYPENFIDICFTKFLNNIHLVKENVPTVEQKRLLLALPYLGIISLQTRTKLQEAWKGVWNCCKLEIVFKCQTRLSNFFRYKDPIPKDLVSGVVYKFQCGLCNESYYSESVRHLDIRSGEHISGEQEVCHLLLKIRSNHEIIILFVIIYSTVNFYPLLTTLVF